MKWRCGSTHKPWVQETWPCRVTWAINFTGKPAGHTCGRRSSSPAHRMPTSYTWTCGGAGWNITQDAGTYLYNADSPWDNSLTTALVHNTITVNGKDQLTRAGRFLYLDWFDGTGRVSDRRPGGTPAGARPNGGGGCRHTRVVSACEDDRWLVEDEVLPLRMPWDKRPRTFRLHWLLPDWNWEIKNNGPTLLLKLETPKGWMTVDIRHSSTDNPAPFSLVRAGELLAGSGVTDSTCGWVSHLYGSKVPALSLAVEINALNEVQFTSEFIFPK